MRLFERLATWFEDRTVSANPRGSIDNMDVNPATGLPTIAGAGTPDVAGNLYGFVPSHDNEFDWQRHDRWDSSGHEPFHHDSWPTSSHDPWRD